MIWWVLGSLLGLVLVFGLAVLYIAWVIQGGGGRTT